MSKMSSFWKAFSDWADGPFIEYQSVEMTPEEARIMFRMNGPEPKQLKKTRVKYIDVDYKLLEHNRDD